MTSEAPCRGLVGVFDPGPGHQAGRARDLSRAVGAPESAALCEADFALVQANGMVHRTEELVCALDGRLTNLETLRAHAGCPDQARAADVVAALYAREGEAVLRRLRGQYLVVLWQPQRGSGLIARDHVGARTAFIQSDGTRLAFASDVDPLVRIAATRPDVDGLALTQWLALGGVLGGRTLYAGIRRLTPGTVLSFDRHGHSERPYWRPRYAPPRSISRDEAAGALRAGLATAVSRHVSGVDRIGVSLSGGLDSSTVAAVAGDILGERRANLTAYSMTFPSHPELDESRLIDTVTDHLRIPSVHMSVTGGGLLAGGAEFLRAWGLPTSAPTTALTTRLQRHAAAQGVTVMLDGDGGDEMFGADEYLAAAYLRAGRIRSAWSVCRRIPGFGAHPSLHQVLRAFRVLALRGAAPYWVHHARRSRRSAREIAPEWSSDQLARTFADSYDPWAWKRSTAPLWWSHLTDTVTSHTETAWVFDYLRQTAALSGLRDGHPLLDPDLMELVLSLPPEYAYDPAFDRALLRESMRGLVPDGVRTRPDKSFFTGLVRSALLGSDLASVTAALTASDAELRAFVNPGALAATLESAMSTQPPRGCEIQLWRLVMAEYWLRSQSDADFPARLAESGSLAPPQVIFSAARGDSLTGHPGDVPTASASRSTFSNLDRGLESPTLSTGVQPQKEAV